MQPYTQAAPNITLYPHLLSNNCLIITLRALGNVVFVIEAVFVTGDLSSPTRLRELQGEHESRTFPIS